MNANAHIKVERECGQFAKNATDVVKGRLTRVRGFPCADVRVFVPGAGGDLSATRHGICFAREKLPELRELVQAMIDACGPAEPAGGGPQ